MTIRDVEVIELLADKPELLAIADAVSATQPQAATPSRRRRVVLRVAPVAAVAAAAIVAMLAWPQGRPGGVLGRALAAVGDGRIMHVVTESPSGIVYVDLKTGHCTASVMREELWVDRRLDHFHLVLSLDGRLLGDILWPTNDGGGSTAPTPNPAFVALWTGYRASLRDGTASLADRGSALGHRVYWLRFKPTSPDQGRFEVAVDARTYKPVLYRTYADGRHVDTRILVAKTIPYRAAEFRRRGPNLLAGSSSGGSSTGPISSSAPAKTVVRAPWLTAGEEAAGLKLRSVDSLVVTSNFRGKRTSAAGVELVYGPVLHGGAGPLSTTVDELPRPDDPNAWKFIPAGSVQVETGGESGSGGTHTLWTGRLRKDGLFISISTPKSERALLAIARALHRGRK
jgi:hypothetical protein